VYLCGLFGTHGTARHGTARHRDRNRDRNRDRDRDRDRDRNRDWYFADSTLEIASVHLPTNIKI
jgi:hypothetical protein